MSDTQTVEAPTSGGWLKNFRYPDEKWERAKQITAWLGLRAGVSGILSLAVDAFIERFDTAYCAANPQYRPLGIDADDVAQRYANIIHAND